MILNLFDRMKLPFRKNKEFLSALYDILGFYPHDISIYRTAFSHKSLSYRRETPAKDSRNRGRGKERRNRNENMPRPLNNERLEYLGDAVLETVVSDILFRHFEHKREGFLTSTRSKIVQREALNRLAEQMGLEKLIQAAQGTRMVHTNIGGNAFEALMGAIYLDRGYKYCHWFITHRVIGPYVDIDNVAQKEVNFKSKLLEWCQKNRISTNFNDTQSGDGEIVFHSSIVLEGITVGQGKGRSKKESQQEASKDALTRMRREQKLYDSIFRSKEKRTAMEADESFALPKIEELEGSYSIGSSKRNGSKPVLESKNSKGENAGKKEGSRSASDAAYDEAYDDDAKFEVIANPEAESEYSEYTTSILPDNEAEEPVQKGPQPQQRRSQNARRTDKDASRRNERDKDAQQGRTKGKQPGKNNAPAADSKDAAAEKKGPAADKKDTTDTPKVIVPQTDSTTESNRRKKSTKPAAGEAKAAEPKTPVQPTTEHPAEAVSEDTPVAASSTENAQAHDTEKTEALQALEGLLFAAKTDEAAAETTATSVVGTAMPEPESDEAHNDADARPAKEPAPLSLEQETRPKLRHISLDEFVFGATEAMPDEATEADASDEADGTNHQPARKKSRRGRSRRAKKEGSASDASNDSQGEAEYSPEPAVSDKPETAADAPAESPNADGTAPAEQRRRRHNHRRRPRNTASSGEQSE